MFGAWTKIRRAVGQASSQAVAYELPKHPCIVSDIVLESCCIVMLNLQGRKLCGQSLFMKTRQLALG